MLLFYAFLEGLVIRATMFKSAIFRCGRTIQQNWLPILPIKGRLSLFEQSHASTPSQPLTVLTPAPYKRFLIGAEVYWFTKFHTQHYYDRGGSIKEQSFCSAKRRAQAPLARSLSLTGIRALRSPFSFIYRTLPRWIYKPLSKPV